MISGEDRKRLELAVPEEALLEMRKLLFSNGLSLQEFLGFIFVVAQKRDANVMSLIDEAKKQKTINGQTPNVGRHTTANELYALMEQNSALKKQK